MHNEIRTVSHECSSVRQGAALLYKDATMLGKNSGMLCKDTALLDMSAARLAKDNVLHEAKMHHC